MSARHFRSLSGFVFPKLICLMALVLLTAQLQGCSWFKKSKKQEQIEVLSPEEYAPSKDLPSSDATRPEDDPADFRRPVGIEDASEVMEVIYFDFDRADIREDQLARLDHNLDYLLEHRDVNVLVEGHCDERGTTEYNFALGERRARSVADYFIANGVTPQRIQILSKGEEEPAAEGHNEEAWRWNRRVEFKFFF